MSDHSTQFVYGTRAGRGLLRLLVCRRMERVFTRFLRSRWSRPVIPWYARRHHIKMDSRQLAGFDTFRDFFARNRSLTRVDDAPEHLISPCDGWLTAYPVDEKSAFSIKGVRYRIEDLIDDPILASRYKGGLCLVFRLSASDCHHYCYIDDGYIWQNHFMPEAIRGIQPPARGIRPANALNRRCWCLMTTRSFGPVIQTEIGAFALGSIVNHQENARICRGDEKGHFELAGSSVALLFESCRVRLFSGILQKTELGGEVRVRQGMRIGSRYKRTNGQIDGRNS